ncbi:MAG: hypothetical protein AB1752_04160 [Candidatus Zixiibacteriota bacterium]
MRKLSIIFVLWLAAASSVYAQPLVNGFVEGIQAVRVEKNAALGDGELGDRSYPRSELRAQMRAEGFSDRGSFFLRVDFVSDATAASRSDVDLREAYIKAKLAEWLDLKLGRQVATWGTGDLIFANDLFAKDWEAFFTGLDDTYLKPPQDLLRASVYLGRVTVEVAASPYFTPDNLPDGSRLSVYNPFPPFMGAVGSDHAPMIHRPSKTLRNGEVFGRVTGTRGSAEWALYGYKGFWPTPQGATMEGVLYYPRLWSTGASLRAPIGAFLAHAEAAAYISQEDTDGTDPGIANSQVRGFAGLEKSLGSEWTATVQYYGEFMLDYDLYTAGLPPGAPSFDEFRSTITARLNKFMRDQTVQLVLFGYWGVSDKDWHARPSLTYKLSDAIGLTAGASLIGGDQPYTMFGQFRDNSNVFTRVRYSF